MTPASQARPPRTTSLLLRWILVLVGVAALIFGGYYFYFQVFSRPTADVYVAAQGVAVSAVYGTVTVTSKQTMLVNAQNSGILKMAPGFGTIVDSNGIAVKQNDLMATVVDEGAQRVMTQARTDYEAALAHKKLGPGSAQGLKTARDQLRAYDNLGPNVVARVQREATRNDVAHLELSVGNEELELQRQFDTAAGTLRNAEEMVKRSEIRAPINGVVVLPFFNDGAYVPSGAALFNLSSTELYVAGQVNEEDVGKIKPGMKAEMHLYAYGNTVFTATLVAVQPNPDPNSSRYTVTLYMDKAPDNLLFGLTGEMNIILGRKEHALIIPARALLIDQVLCVEDGVVAQRTVGVGFKSLEFAEIIKGLREGDEVIVNDQDTFRNGQRARAVPISDSPKAKPGKAKR